MVTVSFFLVVNDLLQAECLLAGHKWCPEVAQLIHQKKHHVYKSRPKSFYTSSSEDSKAIASQRSKNEYPQTTRVEQTEA
jgi:hypothetical protein